VRRRAAATIAKPPACAQEWRNDGLFCPASARTMRRGEVFLPGLARSPGATAQHGRHHRGVTIHDRDRVASIEAAATCCSTPHSCRDLLRGRFNATVLVASRCSAVVGLIAMFENRAGGLADFT
jgi:hypothetical protein